MRSYIIIVFFLFNIESAFACLCASYMTLQEGYKQSNTVVSGTILHKEYLIIKNSRNIRKIAKDTSIRYLSTEVAVYRYDLLVDKVFKGHFSKDTITIYTGSAGSDCGIPFEVGSKYIVYGQKKSYYPAMKGFRYPKGKNMLWTHICLPTTEFSQKAVDVINEIAKKETYYRSD